MPSVANLVQVGDWSRTHREQLASLARATPAAMAGYAINTTIALAVGMAASGSVLLAPPIPSAAILYMSALLLPLIFKSVLVLGGKTYLVLGLLGVSYWFFLAALIATTARLFAQRLQATTKLERSLGELSKAHEETELAAMTDGLTGLPNRRAFVDRLEASGSAAGEQNYGLLYLDLDRFKDANDALGHHIGDDLRSK